MPLLPSYYKRPWFLFSSHLETIFPVAIRSIKKIPFQRKRLELDDGDFIDYDIFNHIQSNTLILISHGLEGSSDAKYVKGMTLAAYGKGYDVIAWNYRGCSGEINRNFRFYHSGETRDLHSLLLHILEKYAHYTSIGLVGFSIGGNITLKYLGEQKFTISPLVKAAVTFSVPVDLKAGAIHLAKPASWFYMRRFLKSLHGKIKLKMKQYPTLISDEGFSKIKNFIVFDERYTAPIHGFTNAYSYYNECSSKRYLNTIYTPTLLVNALNDPFLSNECYPYDEAKQSNYLFLETPSHGGHCGFSEFSTREYYWSENRAIEFMEKYL